jgi:hypothetical protein
MPMLEGKIHLPLAGDVSKKAAAGGALVIVSVIGVAYIRRMRNARTTNNSPSGGTAASAAGDTGMVTDPAGNQCTAVDESGYCPGSEQSIAYSQQAGSDTYDDGYDASDYGDVGAGYGGWAGSSYGGTGYYQDPDGNVCVTPLSNGYCPPVSSTGSTGSQYSSNEAWLTAAEQAMNSTALGEAAERIFAGLSVTTAQKDLFMEAVGLIGPPPQSYPPINTTDTSGQPAPAAKVTVPNVVNEYREVAFPKITAAGLKYTVQGTIAKGHSGIVSAQNPKAGTSVAKGSNVTLTVKQTK